MRRDGDRKNFFGDGFGVVGGILRFGGGGALRRRLAGLSEGSLSRRLLLSTTWPGMELFIV